MRGDPWLLGTVLKSGDCVSLLSAESPGLHHLVKSWYNHVCSPDHFILFPIHVTSPCINCWQLLPLSLLFYLNRFGFLPLNAYLWFSILFRCICLHLSQKENPLFLLISVFVTSFGIISFPTVMFITLLTILKSVNLINALFTRSSRSLIKMLNKTDPNSNPCGNLLAPPLCCCNLLIYSPLATIQPCDSPHKQANFRV